MQSLVFHVLLEAEQTAQDREPSETCVVRDACLHQPRPGEDGTVRSASTSVDTLSLVLLLQLPSHPLFLLVVIVLKRFNEIPLVISSKVEQMKKTKDAIELLKKVNAFADVEKVKISKKLRAGKGKMRNRRFRQRRGPLIIYEKDEGIVTAFRNLPGVELVCVTALNLLTLAPGGHLGRFCLWTEGAFSKLDSIFGTFKVASTQKKGYLLPARPIANSDITRIMQSEEVRAVLRAEILPKMEKAQLKKNPLRNKAAMEALNPYYKTAVEQAKKEGVTKKKTGKKIRASKKFIESLKE